MTAPDTIATADGRVIPLAIGETVYIVPVPGEAIREAVVAEVEKNGKVVVVQYCGVEKWKVAGWVFRTRKEADEQYWKFYESAEVRRQAEEAATLRAERDAALAEVARLKKDLDFLEEKGITVGPMQSSDRADPYLAYVIRPDSELDDTKTISRLTDAEIENIRLRNLLARVEVDERWRPIETAPKDGTMVCLWRTNHGQLLRCWSGAFPDSQPWGFHSWDDAPTHWRPLPLSPADEAELERLRQAVAIEDEQPQRTLGTVLCSICDQEFPEPAECGEEFRRLWTSPSSGFIVCDTSTCRRRAGMKRVGVMKAMEGETP